MNILAIESSSEVLSVALSFKDRVKSLFESHEQFKSEHIIGLVRKTLSKARLKLSDLDYIAVGLGPGSFTGLRVGLASALGLALALDLKIIGVGSLDIIAANVNIGDSDIQDICTIVDARRGNVYAAIFRGVKKKLGYSLLNTRQLLAKINSPTLFLGDGLGEFARVIKEKRGKSVFFAPQDLWYPKASVLARMAYELINKKDSRTKKKRREILPIYLYPKECQIQNEKSKR